MGYPVGRMKGATGKVDGLGNGGSVYFAIAPAVSDEIPGEPLFDIGQDIRDGDASAFKGWTPATNARIRNDVVSKLLHLNRFHGNMMRLCGCGVKGQEAGGGGFHLSRDCFQ